MQDVNWVVNVLPDMISEMNDEDVDCFTELFQEEQEAREAARLRDEGVLEPADVEEAFPRGRGGARRSGGERSVNPPRERSRRGSSRGANRPGREHSREPMDPNQPGRWRRRERVRSRSRAVSRARDADRATRGDPPRVDLQTILINEGEEAARQHAERSTDRLHGGPARLHRPRAEMPDDAVERATPGVGREGQRLRLMGDAPIPAFPDEPGQARALSDWVQTR